jgi:hypothetical protein
VLHKGDREFAGGVLVCACADESESFCRHRL